MDNSSEILSTILRSKPMEELQNVSQFEITSPSFIAISAILSTICLCTIVGNVFVITAILIDKNLQTAANQLVLSLAVADLMVACLVMPLGAYNDLYKGWYLGTKICMFWTSADVLCCTASILNLLAIAMDRYWAVTSADYIYRRTKRRVNVMIGCAWTVSAIVSLAPILGWEDRHFAERVLIEHKCLVSQDVAYQIFATISTFYAPLVLILGLYWRIYKVARKRIRRKPGRSEQLKLSQPLALETDDTQNDNNNKTESKASLRGSHSSGSEQLNFRPTIGGGKSLNAEAGVLPTNNDNSKSTFSPNQGAASVPRAPVELMEKFDQSNSGSASRVEVRNDNPPGGRQIIESSASKDNQVNSKPKQHRLIGMEELILNCQNLARSKTNHQHGRRLVRCEPEAISNDQSEQNFFSSSNQIKLERDFNDDDDNGQTFKAISDEIAKGRQRPRGSGPKVAPVGCESIGDELAACLADKLSRPRRRRPQLVDGKRQSVSVFVRLLNGPTNSRPEVNCKRLAGDDGSAKTRAPFEHKTIEPYERSGADFDSAACCCCCSCGFSCGQFCAPDCCSYCATNLSDQPKETKNKIQSKPSASKRVEEEIYDCLGTLGANGSGLCERRDKPMQLGDRICSIISEASRPGKGLASNSRGASVQEAPVGENPTAGAEVAVPEVGEAAATRPKSGAGHLSKVTHFSSSFGQLNAHGYHQEKCASTADHKHGRPPSNGKLFLDRDASDNDDYLSTGQFYNLARNKSDFVCSTKTGEGPDHLSDGKSSPLFGRNNNNNLPKLPQLPAQIHEFKTKLCSGGETKFGDFSDGLVSKSRVGMEFEFLNSFEEREKSFDSQSALSLNSSEGSGDSDDTPSLSASFPPPLDRVEPRGTTTSEEPINLTRPATNHFRRPDKSEWPQRRAECAGESDGNKFAKEQSTNRHNDRMQQRQQRKQFCRLHADPFRPVEEVANIRNNCSDGRLNFNLSEKLWSNSESEAASHVDHCNDIIISSTKQRLHLAGQKLGGDAEVVAGHPEAGFCLSKNKLFSLERSDELNQVRKERETQGDSNCKIKLLAGDNDDEVSVGNLAKLGQVELAETGERNRFVVSKPKFKLLGQLVNLVHSRSFRNSRNRFNLKREAQNQNQIQNSLSTNSRPSLSLSSSPVQNKTPGAGGSGAIGNKDKGDNEINCQFSLPESNGEEAEVRLTKLLISWRLGQRNKEEEAEDREKINSIFQAMRLRAAPEVGNKLNQWKISGANSLNADKNSSSQQSKQRQASMRTVTTTTATKEAPLSLLEADSSKVTVINVNNSCATSSIRDATRVGPKSIVTAISSHNNNHINGGSKRTQQESVRKLMETKKEKKAAKTLAIITGVFVCCWLPFFLNTLLMSICGLSCVPSELVLSILLWLGYLNSLLNPIIYTIFSPDFRRAFKRILYFGR